MTATAPDTSEATPGPDAPADPTPGAALFVADVARCRPPLVGSRTVARPSLMHHLETLSSTPVVVVRAPAGSGKTTTLAQWGARDSRPWAWVSVSPLDDDPVNFLHHIVFALGATEAIPADVTESLAGPDPRVATVVLPRLGRALERRAPFVLVLDDIHLVSSAAALECIPSLIRHLPEGSQLILSGRRSPLVTLSTARLEERVADVTERDLAMNALEAGEIMARAGITLTPDQSGALMERTEGWAAGLHLAALALRTAPDRADEWLARVDPLTAEYLRDAFLAEVPPELSVFLTETAILDDLSAAVCDDVLERDDSAELLARLTGSGNLFLVPLDDDRTHFRYHHLFADLLRSELHAQNPTREEHLRRRASRACLDAGDVDGAVRHLIAAGDRRAAADLVFAHALAFAGRGRNATLGLWIELFAEADLETLAPLALAKAIHSLGLGDIELVDYWLAVAGHLTCAEPLADGSPSLEVAIAALRSVSAPRGIPQVLLDTETVVASPRDGNMWWGTAMLIRGATMLMMGELETAQTMLEEAEAATFATPPAHAVALAWNASLATESGDWARAHLAIDHARRTIDRNQLHEYPAVLPAVAISAFIASHEGDTERARLDGGRTRRMLVSIGHLSAKNRLHANVQLARAARLYGDVAHATEFVRAAEPCRIEEPTARLLIDQLDEVTAWLHAQGGGDSTGAGAALTPAELRVLEYLPTHLSLKEISERLYVSRNTVKSQAISSYRKLGVSSRSDAVARAKALGLIEA